MDSLTHFLSKNLYFYIIIINSSKVTALVKFQNFWVQSNLKIFIYFHPQQAIKKIASDRPGWIYSHLADELKNDEEIAFMAVTDSAFQYIELPEKFKFNRDFLVKSIDIVKDQNTDDIQYIFYDELLSLFKEDKEVNRLAQELLQKDD